MKHLLETHAETNPRIFLIIDGANLFYAQRDSLGWHIDPRRLKEWVAQFGEVTMASYYVGAKKDCGPDDRFRNALAKMGYRVVSKPIKQMGTTQKANFDVEMAVDMVTQMPFYDICVMVSGDSDFVYAYETIRGNGKGFAVVSHRWLCGLRGPTACWTESH